MDFIKSFGFTDVDKPALIKLHSVIEVVVFNMLNNVLYVVDALKVKTVKKGHFLGVLHLLKEAAKRCGEKKKGQAGGTVMASEFFGHDSGRFFAEVDFHNTAYLDNLSRGGLEVMQAGGSGAGAGAKANAAVSLAELKEIVAAYKKETDRASLKLAADVYPLVQEAVSANLAGLLRACKKAAGSGQGVLTAKLLVKCIKGEFAHVQHVWK
jgi:hypothetical protein